MRIRALAVAAGLGVALLASACATSVAGQAQPNPAALSASLISTTGDSPTDLTAPSTDPISSEEATEPQTAETTTAPTSEEATTERQTTEQQSSDAPTTTRSSRSTTPGGITSIPGFSADCNQILAGVTAFGSLLSDASSGSADAKLSQAQVDKALKNLPASGLPAKAQADVNILRAAAIGAAGKTVLGLAMTLQDGKVVAAIQDLSTWISTNCS